MILGAMTGDPTDDDLLAEAVDWRLRIEAEPDDEALRAALDAWLAASAAHARPTGCRAHDARCRRPAGRLRRSASQTPAAPAPGAPLPRSRVAACIAFLFLPTAQLWLASDYQTATAELRRITLDDGSVVSLDAASAIAVRYGAARREVALLSGRAFFEVVPAADRPFVVAVDDATVTVTGTAFDVRSSAQTTSVAVQSGTVEVALDHGRRRAATLTRGERLDIDRKSGSPRPVRHFLPTTSRRGASIAWSSTRRPWPRSWRNSAGTTPASCCCAIGALADRLVSGIFDLRHPIEALQAAVRTHDGSVTRITPYVVVISGP